MRFRHIFFDLDGTLLPMRQEAFVAHYMPLLAGAFERRRSGIDKRALIATVWDGYRAMVGNDGSKTNREAFWESMEGRLPLPRQEAEAAALDFYSGDFNRAKAATQPTPLAQLAVRRAKENGMAVYLATNPVFPRCATENRIRWAGLDAADFEIITTYEDCRFCKPNPSYFSDLLNRFSLDPEECLMVGNDVEEDLAAGQVGISTFLVTDTMENFKHLPIRSDYQGSLQELADFIGNGSSASR